ncbi:28895_t:CDS:2, partial [Racocetra persica]
IWRGQEVSMIEWYQPISDSIAPLNQDLSIPKSHLPNIGQVNIAENSNGQTSAFETHQINKDILLQSNGSSNLYLNSNVTSDKRVDTVNKLTKKVGGKDDMYTLIKRKHREAEEAEH